MRCDVTEVMASDARRARVWACGCGCGRGLFDSWRGAASATCAACALGARGCALRAPLRPQGGGAHAKQGTRLRAGVREACAQGARVVLARRQAAL